MLRRLSLDRSVWFCAEFALLDSQLKQKSRPVCVGGHPLDPRNLWLQPRTGEWAAKFKDQLESSVCRQLCRGDITLEEAQAIFLRPDWTVEWARYFEQ